MARTFFALSESSVDSMVMYFSPLILTPFEMTALGSLLSEKDAAIAPISAAVSWRTSVHALETICAKLFHVLRNL